MRRNVPTDPLLAPRATARESPSAAGTQRDKLKKVHILVHMHIIQHIDVLPTSKETMFYMLVSWRYEI